MMLFLNLSNLFERNYILYNFRKHDSIIFSQNANNYTTSKVQVLYTILQ